MAQLKYKDEVFNVSSGSSVLDTLLEHGHEIPNNCRAGACQSCVMQVTKGSVPEQAQIGLKDSHKTRGFFLACSCRPEEDIDICLPDADQTRIPACVSKISKLSNDVVELKIVTVETFAYHAGQYVTLWRDEYLGRSYSLASLPQPDEALTFHIRLIPDGMFSGWVHKELRVGDTIFVQGPIGDCFYTRGKPEQNLLLAGTGTGLAPLLGIMRDALNSEHTGEIHLFHGALTLSGLYLHDDITMLEGAFSNLSYYPCVLNAEKNMPDNVIEGDISKIISASVRHTCGWKTFLSGNQGLVETIRKQVFLAGCNMKDIYADPFIHS
ncbi:MAG: FAD-binding oxidoreductase [Gammaproteobacteria bacterium]|nr:MAG: FAD-binding oxidoreductase [Gammaproteobacteria bacterium]